MSYIGDDGYAAPQLRSYDVEDTDEAEALVDQVLGAIERMLFLNVVHGDLSPYNLLVWEGQVTVIDLPHKASPEEPACPRVPRARRRANLRVALTTGVDRHAGRIAGDLWTGWEFAELVPEELRGLTM